MPVIMSIDPGLARLGWAAWDVTGMPAVGLRQVSAEFVAPRLVGVGSFTTQPEHELAHRLRLIGGWGRERFVDCAEIVVELPGAGGTAYGRNRNGREQSGAAVQGVFSVALSVGVLLGVATALNIPADLIRASTRPKAVRWDWCRLAVEPGLRRLRRSARTNKEERDALYYGVRAITDTRRKWA